MRPLRGMGGHREGVIALNTVLAQLGPPHTWPIAEEQLFESKIGHWNQHARFRLSLFFYVNDVPRDTALAVGRHPYLFEDPAETESERLHGQRKRERSWSSNVARVYDDAQYRQQKWAYHIRAGQDVMCHDKRTPKWPVPPHIAAQHVFRRADLRPQLYALCGD